MTRLQFAGLAFAALVACNDGSGPSPPREGVVRVRLTDAPFPYDQVSRADIYVLKIAASRIGESAEQTIVTPNRAYDLVALQNGRTADLGEGVLDPGTYDRVVVWIDPDRSSITLKDGTVLTGSSTPGIAWKSATGAVQTPFEVFVESPIEVTKAGALLVVDFDLARSFRPLNPTKPASGFQFAPAARAIDGTQAGAVSGTVTGEGGGPLADATVGLYATVADPSPSPSDPAPTLALWQVARSDAAGRFYFPFVLPGRAYSVIAEGPVESSFGISTRRDVSVTTRTETNVGTVAVPRFDPQTVPGTYVLRRVGLLNSRELPALVWPGPTQIWLAADTLVLNATAGGSEVRVDRIAHPGEPPVTRTTRATMTFNLRGRVISITYRCPTGDCMLPVVPVDGVLEGTLLTLYFSPEDLLSTWPRVFERVGP